MSDAPPPPPGWYPASDRLGTQRYWDGTAWTNDYAPLSRPEALAPAVPQRNLTFKAQVLPDDVIMTLNQESLSWRNRTTVTRLVLSWTMALCTLGFSLLVYPPSGGKKYGGSVARKQIVGSTSTRVSANYAELTILTTGTPVVFRTDALTASRVLDALSA